jgi:hypothetical protein
VYFVLGLLLTKNVIKGPVSMQNLFPSTPSSADILKPGTYQVELVSLKPGQGRAFENKPPRPTITFCFREIKSLTPINRTVAATRDPRGKLLDFVKQLSGIHQPTQQQIGDGEAFTQFINSMIGKIFTASIAPSENGRFNNIVGIQPEAK